MAELAVNFVVENLNKVKKSLENIQIGGSTSGGGGTSKSSSSSTAIMAGGFAFLGGLLGGIVGQLDGVKAIIGVVAGLVNQLVAPFVPLLLGLFKPVFILLNAVLKKIFQIIQGEGGGTGILALITGGLAALAVVLSGGGVLIAGAIALLVAGLSKYGFEFAGDAGKSAREKLDATMAKVSDMYDNIIVSATSKLLPKVQKLEDILGVELTNPFMKIAVNVKRLKDGLEEITNGLLNLDFAQIKKGFITALESYKNILSGVFEFIITVFSGLFKLFISKLTSILNSVLNFFTRVWNGFIQGLVSIINSVINYINSVLPFGNVSTIDNPGRASSTQININIEGSADQATVQAAVNLMRSELSRRGAI